jgi:hypothetical protein
MSQEPIYEMLLEKVSGLEREVAGRGQVEEVFHEQTRDKALTLSIEAGYSAREKPFEQLPHLWKRMLAGEVQTFEWKARRPLDGTLFDAGVVLRRMTINGRRSIIARFVTLPIEKRLKTSDSSVKNFKVCSRRLQQCTTN